MDGDNPSSIVEVDWKVVAFRNVQAEAFGYSA